MRHTPFGSIVVVLVLTAAAFGQTLGDSSVDDTDPVVCFDHVWRDARNAVQAYQISDRWKREVDCKTKAPAAPELTPCWDLVMNARPLIEQAGDFYEQGRRARDGRTQQQLVRRANELIRRASEIVRQAGECFQPIFSRWQANGGRYVASGHIGSQSPEISVPRSLPGIPFPPGPRSPLPAPQPRQPDFDAFSGRDSVVLAARAAADAIIAGENAANELSRLNKAQRELPPSVPRPIQCWGMLIDAMSKQRSRPDYVTPQAQRAVACYEGWQAGAQQRTQPSQRATDSRTKVECAVLPLAADVTRQLQDLNAKTASVARVVGTTGAGFLTKMAQAVGARVGMYVRATDDVASLSPYQLPFTMADPVRRDRIARRLMTIYEFAADTTDNIRVGFQFMDQHPKESAWILYRGAVQAVKDIDREIEAVKKDPTRAGPMVGTAVTDAAVAGACAWGGRLLISSEEMSTVGMSVANLERIEDVFKPAGIQAFGNWRKATPASQEFVDLWHGSRSNATAIHRDGFTYRADTVTFFGNTKEAAQNAIADAVDPATDPGIFLVRLPREVWNSAVENGHVFERPYAGFGGVLQSSTTREYRINSAAMIDAINRFRERMQ